MAIELNTDKLSSTFIDAGTDQASGTAAKGGAQAILGGASVQVTDASATDLEKLVARIKNENEQRKADMAQRRIAILLTVLNAMSNRVTEQQRNGLVQLDKLTTELSTLEENLEKLEEEREAYGKEADVLAEKIEQLEKTIRQAAATVEELNAQIEDLKRQQASASPADAAVMDAKIKALEAAVERAVQDGEDHRKQVEKLKAQKAETELKERRAADSAAATRNRIEAVAEDIAHYEKIVGTATLAEVAAAVRAAAGDVRADPEHAETAAEAEKAELKALANDPLAAIREALDRLDADILRTIEENQVIKA